MSLMTRVCSNPRSCMLLGDSSGVAAEQEHREMKLYFSLVGITREGFSLLLFTGDERRNRGGFVTIIIDNC